MSYTKQVTIWCEGKTKIEDEEYGCGNWDTVNGSSLAKARLLLKKCGWTHSKGKDYCPECSRLLKQRLLVS